MGIVRPSTAESSSRRWLNWGANIPATLEELKNMSGVKGSIMAIQRALNRLGCRYKRNASRQRARPGGCKSLEKAVDPRGGQT
ncbi:MAG: hypothetical protein GKR87_10955 [Kiritimatiellae bacterium]|nr:hypothetical protein [Kiritimatiellia bacterium]